MRRKEIVLVLAVLLFGIFGEDFPVQATFLRDKIDRLVALSSKATPSGVITPPIITPPEPPLPPILPKLLATPSAGTSLATPSAVASPSASPSATMVASPAAVTTPSTVVNAPPSTPAATPATPSAVTNPVVRRAAGVLANLLKTPSFLSQTALGNFYSPGGLPDPVSFALLSLAAVLVASGLFLIRTPNSRNNL